MNEKTHESILRNLFPAIIVAWLVAGTMDITAAIINYTANGGKNPEIIFKYIASAALGKSALTGGTGMIILGGVFHYIVALACTLVFFALYRTKWLAQNPFVAGLEYGVFVFIIMNMVVVPLSTIGKETINISKGRIEMGILMLCIGLPISLIANKHFSYQKTGIS